MSTTIKSGDASVVITTSSREDDVEVGRSSVVVVIDSDNICSADEVVEIINAARDAQLQIMNASRWQQPPSGDTDLR